MWIDLKPFKHYLRKFAKSVSFHAKHLLLMRVDRLSLPSQQGCGHSRVRKAVTMDNLGNAGNSGTRARGSV